MTTRLMACAFSTVIHFTAAAPAGGQIATAMPDSGFVQSRAVERDRVDGECVTSLGPSFRAEIRNSTCRVVEVVDLGTTGSVLWAAARYIRAGTSDFIEPGDSVLLDEAVLFSRAAADSLLVPRWRLTKDRTYNFITSVNGTGTPDRLIVELVTCLNGTGGCTRDYLIASDSSLRVVDKPFVQSLIARLPAGLRLHKGMTLDLETLMGAWPVAEQRDANCCPSWTFEYEVRWEDNALVLVSAQLSRFPGPPRH